MSRYIKLDDVRAIFCQSNSLTQAWNGFDRLPSIDIEPKRGKWMPVKASIHPYGNDVKCSVCGHRMGSSFGYNFCPYCGADMRKREGE